MKLSISWIFDHISADWHSFDISELVSRLNSSSAEIEHVQFIELDSDSFTLATVTKQGESTFLTSLECGTIEVSFRADAQPGNLYMMVRRKGIWDWAHMTDLGGSKEGAIPAVSCPEDLRAGGWKAAFEWSDYILDVDNKSITHRPDMWGHRGFAREIAALYNLPLKKTSDFLTHLSIKKYGSSFKADAIQPISITLHEGVGCSRFAAVFLPDVHNIPSVLWIVNRLSKTDHRSVNAVVDATNYGMLDFGYPMHAFDAATLLHGSLSIRKAQPKETLVLLDSQTIELNAADIIIADGQTPISLAGVMGGISTSVTLETRNVLLEAASFDAATIRRTAARHKKRSEASARFEKTLDPQQNIQALLRCVKVLEECGIACEGVDSVVSLGIEYEPLTIEVSHRLIEEKIGMTLESARIRHILEKLGMGVKQEGDEPALVRYIVTVPTFRASKDIRIPEDVIEEIARMVGYHSIPRILPERAVAPANLSVPNRIRAIKRLLAFGARMHEVYTYALYDESFLSILGWQPEHAASVQSPVSLNWQRLVTSLIPNLMRCVFHTATTHDDVKFFEWARIWHTHNGTIVEKKSLAGIWYSKTGIDFYTAKQDLELLFASLHLPVVYKQIQVTSMPWFAQYQSAEIMYQERVIGRFGLVPAGVTARLAQGGMAVFELDGEFLEQYSPEKKKFKAPSKYPDVIRDVSMFVPIALSVQALKNAVLNAESRIEQVTIQDFFEKAEWIDRRAVTVRYVIVDREKTLTGHEVEAVHTRVENILREQGVTIR